MSASFPFFQKAMLALLGKRNFHEGLVDFFAVLKGNFPMEAMSFDHYLPESRSLFVHYVVTEKGFFDVKAPLPLTKSEADYVRDSEDKLLLLYKDHSSNNKLIARKHSKLLEAYIPFKDRAYMVAMLHVDDRVIGHLALMGKEVGCFTEEHARMLEMILPACALAMSNMLDMQDINQRNERMKRERVRLLHELEMFTHSQIVGAQGGLRNVLESLRHLADNDTPVLILGETGTGKEVVANAIQRQSGRSGGPFIKVNCGALSDTLLDSELFGHEKGAFTGAIGMRQGRFEQADGGTLFLDEVGELSPQAQVRLLRVLQDGTFERIGGGRCITVDVRIVAATNRDLQTMCREGRFREDLFHRLNVFPINMPPLRERLEDLPLLLRFLAERTAERLGVPVPHIIMDHMDQLMRYPWPGNVRELENLVERAFIVSSGGPLNIAELLPDPPAPLSVPELTNLCCPPQSAHPQQDGAWVSREYLDQYIESKIRELHRQPAHHAPEHFKESGDTDARMAARIRRALEVSNGKVSGPGGAAELLGLNANTLRSRIRKLGLSPASIRGAGGRGQLHAGHEASTGQNLRG